MPDKDESEKKYYEEEFGWKITGTGEIRPDKIGLILEDGTLSNFGDFFDHVDLTIYPIPSGVPDSEKVKYGGSLNYLGPNIYIDLYVSLTPFKQFCNELKSGTLTKMKIGVFVDFFRSEVDSSFGGDSPFRIYYIEKKGNINRAYPSSITASREIDGRKENINDNKEEDD